MSEHEDAAVEMVRLLMPTAVLMSAEPTGVRSKPLIGGVFGLVGFRLGSINCIDTGLDVPTYFVREESTGMLLSMGSAMSSTLKLARFVISTLGAVGLGRMRVELLAFQQAAAAERCIKAEAKSAERQAAEAQVPRIASVPRRRRRIFDEAGGKCHYCATPLTLEGRWHIEHMMPRALMGNNDPSNLVASCVPCNIKKRDRTDQEFKAELAQVVA